MERYKEFAELVVQVVKMRGRTATYEISPEGDEKSIVFRLDHKLVAWALANIDEAYENRAVEVEAGMVYEHLYFKQQRLTKGHQAS